jgi:hypothetical protein
MVDYTDAAAIEAYLGVAFTPEQTAAAGEVASAVTIQIDRYIGRSWQGVSPVVGELRHLIPPMPGGAYPATVAFLARAPVVAVTAVSVRSGSPNGAETVVAAVDYELIDPASGIVAIAIWYQDWWNGSPLAVVDYTYADEVPADIGLAATMMASAEMARQLAIQGSASAASGRPSDLDGVKSLSVGQNDIAVTFEDGASAATSGGSASGSALAPPGSAARTILDSYRRVVIA